MAASGSGSGAVPNVPKQLTDAELKQKTSEAAQNLQTLVKKMLEGAEKLKQAGKYHPQVDYDANQKSAFKELLEKFKTTWSIPSAQPLVNDFCDNQLNDLLEEIHDESLTGNPPNVDSWNNKIAQAFDHFKAYIEFKKDDFVGVDADTQLAEQKKAVVAAAAAGASFGPTDLPGLQAKLLTAEQKKKKVEDARTKGNDAKTAHDLLKKDLKEYSHLLKDVSQSEAACAKKLQELNKLFQKAKPGSDKQKYIEDLRKLVKDRFKMYEDYRAGVKPAAPTAAALATARDAFLKAQAARDELKSPERPHLDIGGKARKAASREFNVKQEELNKLEELDKLSKLDPKKHPDLDAMRKSVDSFNKQINEAASGKTPVALNKALTTDVIHRELVHGLDPSKVPNKANPADILKAVEDKLRQQLEKIIGDPTNQKVLKEITDNPKNAKNPAIRRLEEWLTDPSKIQTATQVDLLSTADALSKNAYTKDVDHWAGLLRVAADIHNNPGTDAETNASQLLRLQPYALMQFDRVRNGLVKSHREDMVDTVATSVQAAQKEQIDAQKDLGAALQVYQDELKAKLPARNPADQAAIQGKIDLINGIPKMDSASQQKTALFAELDKWQKETKNATLAHMEQSQKSLEKQASYMNTNITARAMGWRKHWYWDSSREWKAVNRKSDYKTSELHGVSGLGSPGWGQQAGNRVIEYQSGEVYKRKHSNFALAYSESKPDKDGNITYNATPISKKGPIGIVAKSFQNDLTSLLDLTIVGMLVTPFLRRWFKANNYKESVEESVDMLLSTGKVKTLNLIPTEHSEFKADDTDHQELLTKYIKTHFAVALKRLKKNPEAFSIDKVKQIGFLSDLLKQHKIDYAQYQKLRKVLESFPDIHQKKALGEGLKDTADAKITPPPAPMRGRSAADGGGMLMEADEEKKALPSVAEADEEAEADVLIDLEDPDKEIPPDDIELEEDDDDDHDKDDKDDKDGSITISRGPW